MGGFSIMHILVFGVVAALLLGGGRFSALMGDVAKGVKQFKKGMADEDDASSHPVPPRTTVQLQQQTPLEPNPDRNLQPVRDDRPHD